MHAQLTRIEATDNNEDWTMWGNFTSRNEIRSKGIFCHKSMTVFFEWWAVLFTYREREAVNEEIGKEVTLECWTPVESSYLLQNWAQNSKLVKVGGGGRACILSPHYLWGKDLVASTQRCMAVLRCCWSTCVTTAAALKSWEWPGLWGYVSGGWPLVVNRFHCTASCKQNCLRLAA